MIRKKENRIKKTEQSILKYSVAKPTVKVKRIIRGLYTKLLNIRNS